MKPHQMTSTDFVAQAKAIKIENNERMWMVMFGNDHVLISAETPELAKAGAHYIYCSNAVFFNDPDNVGLCLDDNLPSMPTDEVLEPYPDLLMWKIEMATDVASEGTSSLGNLLHGEQPTDPNTQAWN
ncbi:hypothetical protein QAO71_17010 (plasmid) [Halopseudomonas sp. SMJS2]|uniref:hypothetical protein n=1 Tax=Halopseudomonas sp. SMJS2 TaxID=3041098 RepID=UPI00245358E9|nr:hypothetical protein [Halopseudomonas sp. SMJS2]WGK63471.1 hypothetical protein QAO71_17010 [Halopseudomonas sp. SMJS2]